MGIFNNAGSILSNVAGGFVGGEKYHDYLLILLV